MKRLHIVKIALPVIYHKDLFIEAHSVEGARKAAVDWIDGNRGKTSAVVNFSGDYSYEKGGKGRVVEVYGMDDLSQEQKYGMLRRSPRKSYGDTDNMKPADSNYKLVWETTEE